jgi:hypothetical protein
LSKYQETLLQQQPLSPIRETSNYEHILKDRET